jgi:hypothetical protein
MPSTTVMTQAFATSFSRDPHPEGPGADRVKHGRADRTDAVRPTGQDDERALLGRSLGAEDRRVDQHEAPLGRQAGQPVEARDADRAGLQPDGSRE